MGDYLTYAKLTTRIPSRELMQLLDVADDGQLETVATDLISDVEAEVLSYIEARREAPTATESRVIEAICYRRFLFRAASDRRSATEAQEKDFDRDTEWLEAYIEGKRSLGDDAAAADKAVTQYSADTRVHTRDTLKGF